MSVTNGLPAMTPSQRDTYRHVYDIAVEPNGGLPAECAEIEASADRIAGRLALGGWYGLRASERAAPLSALGRRILRFQINDTTRNSR